MSERVLLRVLCSRAKHIVGTVHAGRAGGYELHYKAAVRVAGTGSEREDFQAADRVFRPVPGDAAPGFDAYCATCRRRFFVPVDQIFSSAARGASAFRLQGRNAAARFKNMRPSAQ